jgi:hypothetical protein
MESKMQPTVTYTFSVEEVNLILDALLDKPARASMVLIKRVESEAMAQLQAAAVSTSHAEEGHE